jgi:hypothetical protein
MRTSRLRRYVARFDLTPRVHRGVLFGLVALGAVQLILLSDLKGISSDEGLRLLTMNGGQLFQGDRSGTTASLKDVMTAVRDTNYQPLYYLLQNRVMTVARSTDPVLLRTANILFAAALLGGTACLARRWPPVAALYLVGTIAFSGYFATHVLQIREYTLGLLFLLLVYLYSCRLVQRSERTPLFPNILQHVAYGLLAVGACLNSFWILPAWCGAVAGQWALAKRRLEATALLACSVVSAMAGLRLLRAVQGFEKKVDVGLWDQRDASAAQVAEAFSDGISFILAGSEVPPSGAGAAARILALAVFTTAAAGALLVAVRPSIARGSDKLRMHIVLSGFMLGALCLFQICYFLVRKDMISLWARYFFQHFWLLHVLIAAIIGMMAHRLRPRATRVGIGAFLLLSAAWAIQGTVQYWRNPYSDTGLGRDCQWRVFASRLRELSRGDPIVFTRTLEAATASFSERFPNSLLLVDKLGADAAAWPSTFRLVEILGTPIDESAARVADLSAAYFDVVGREHVTGGQACNIAATVYRMRRPW